MTHKEQHNKILIEILDEIVRVCKDNGLTYYLAAGTLLGAVRHKGMIPWDDDIDIVMPRKDYDWLCEHGDMVFSKEFHLASYQHTSGYLYDAMKVESMNTTLIERVNPIYVGGVFVDVFPLDNVPSLEINDDLLEARKPYAQDYVNFLINPAPQVDIWHYLQYLIQRKRVLSRKVLAKFDQCVSKYKEHKTVYLNDYHSDYAEWEVMPYEYYGEGTELMFEGKMYQVPSNYDAVLRTIYGDYMQLPPVEKRVDKHNFIFEDLTHRLSDEELKPIISDLKKKYDYHFSVKRELRSLKRCLKRLVCK